MKQKGKFPAHFLSFLSPEDFRDAFCVVGVPLDAPGCDRRIRRLTRRTQDFTMKGVHVVGQGVWGRKSPLRSRDSAPVGVLDEVLQKPKQNAK